jgi:hypothetical protein
MIAGSTDFTWLVHASVPIVTGWAVEALSALAVLARLTWRTRNVCVRRREVDTPFTDSGVQPLEMLVTLAACFALPKDCCVIYPCADRARQTCRHAGKGIVVGRTRFALTRRHVEDLSILA